MSINTKITAVTIVDRYDDSSVAMGSDGDFVITWQSSGQDGSKDGIFSKRYDKDGDGK